jgi:hypothetical protein
LVLKFGFSVEKSMVSLTFLQTQVWRHSNQLDQMLVVETITVADVMMIVEVVVEKIIVAAAVVLAVVMMLNVVTTITTTVVAVQTNQAEIAQAVVVTNQRAVRDN